jgi:hypothetical protein
MLGSLAAERFDRLKGTEKSAAGARSHERRRAAAWAWLYGDFAPILGCF